MPQTLAEWRYLAGLYEDKFIQQDIENQNLRSTVNNLRQKIEKLKCKI